MSRRGRQSRKNIASVAGIAERVGTLSLRQMFKNLSTSGFALNHFSDWPAGPVKTCLFTSTLDLSIVHNLNETGMLLNKTLS